MPYLTHTPYIAPPFAEVEITVRGEMNAAWYDKYTERLAAIDDVVVSSIEYDSDDLRITGLEALPLLEAGEKIPLIIYNRGGSGDFGGLSAAQILNLMVPMVQQLRAGVLASNYRGNMGSEGREEFGGADVHDVLNLIDVGKQQAWWDGKNIFMLGWSRGGMMTYRAIAEGAKLNAAAVGAGVADAMGIAKERPDMLQHVMQKFIPGFSGHADAELRKRSALQWPEKLTVPLLLLHGDADTKVDVSHARRMHEALAAQGTAVRYVEYPKGSHGLVKENEAVMREVAAWFTAHRK